MWDLPRLGIEPVSPALAGGLITTGPSGKPSGLNLDGAHCSYLFTGSSSPLDMVSSYWVSAPGLGSRYSVVYSLRNSQLHIGRKTQGKCCCPQAQGAWGDPTQHLLEVATPCTLKSLELRFLTFPKSFKLLFHPWPALKVFFGGRESESYSYLQDGEAEAGSKTCNQGQCQTRGGDFEKVRISRVRGHQPLISMWRNQSGW